MTNAPRPNLDPPNATPLAFDPFAFFACPEEAPIRTFHDDADAYCPTCTWHWLHHNATDRADGRLLAQLAHHPSGGTK